MKSSRVPRVNSLLQEVITETLRKNVKNPHIHALTTITHVEVTSDLQHAKVYVSVIANEKEQKETIDALNGAAGFIAVHSSKKVSLRFFPELHFKLDRSAEHAAHIEELLNKVIPKENNTDSQS
jgi:ribosome-binding factor A